MRRVIVFNQVSLDGYFTDIHGDMGWAHKSDPEWDAFVTDNASGGGTLVFGRVTYDMMASFWPTPVARKLMPVVAKQMTALPKVVFSRTMKKASWKNTTLVKEDPAKTIRRMKKEKGSDMVVMGSGSIVAALAEADLVDEYQLVFNPIILGGGRALSEGVSEQQRMRRTSTRTFENGNVFVCYERER